MGAVSKIDLDGKRSNRWPELYRAEQSKTEDLADDLAGGDENKPSSPLKKGQARRPEPFKILAGDGEKKRGNLLEMMRGFPFVLQPPSS